MRESGVFRLLEATPATVLVVDDDEPIRKLLASLLTPRGYIVEQAASAEEAHEKLPRVVPDLVVLDLHMTGLSGHDLLREIRSTPATRLLPVIMLTGTPTGQDKLKAIEGGVTDFIAKPFGAEELLARVQSLVQMKRFTDALEDAENVIVSLAKIIDARDPYTARHSERVSLYAGRLAGIIGLKGLELEACRRGGLFHDLGKIAIRDAVLLKPGRLSPEELAEIKRHPVEGKKLLTGMKTLAFALDVVLSHHERLDGSGYPRGLSGDSIPITARITTIADIYDALTTARVYRAALPRDEALALMEEEAQRGWWDGQLLAEFPRVLETIPTENPLSAARESDSN
jgi:putative two-component system response regulator